MVKFEIVIPTDWGKDIFDKVVAIAEEKTREYAFAEHPVDELASFSHWHVGFLLHSNFNADDILKWFKDIDKIKNNSIQSIKSHWKTYIVYILHKTENAIKQGKSLPVSYGGSVDFDTVLSDYVKRGHIKHLIDDIMDGTIKEYQFFADKGLVKEVINANMYNKVLTTFKAYSESKQIGANRTMERKHFWIYGMSGSGKTELAKFTCKRYGYNDNDIYITSSGSNPLDDYKGQPCVIVDDIDGQTMTPKTALKLIDIFTNSTIGARYYNKHIDAVLIGFTSTVSPKSWWGCSANEKVDGNIYQLYRRLNLGIWHIDDLTVECFLYDGQGNFANSFKMSLPDDIANKVRNNKVCDTINELKVLFADSTGHTVSFHMTNIEMSDDDNSSDNPFLKDSNK